jgi:hypothetical protein
MLENITIRCIALSGLRTTDPCTIFTTPLHDITCTKKNWGFLVSINGRSTANVQQITRLHKLCLLIQIRANFYFADVDDLIEPLVEYLNSNSSFGLIQTDPDLIVCCLNSLGKLACEYESRARLVFYNQ